MKEGRVNSVGYSIVLQVDGENGMTDVKDWKFKYFTGGNNNSQPGRRTMIYLENQKGIPVKDIPSKINVKDVEGIYFPFYNVVIPVSRYSNNVKRFLQETGGSLVKPKKKHLLSQNEIDERMIRLNEGLKSIFADYMPVFEMTKPDFLENKKVSSEMVDAESIVMGKSPEDSAGMG
jgi:hypothetical protein